MIYSGSANLAILACPGGEHFADAVIKHLKHIYVEKLNRKIDKLIKRYNLQKETLIRDINFYNDLLSSGLHEDNEIEKIRIPRFKVNARFTYFMNGEFKTEILECIRGKNVFIFQDVENHHPLWVNEGKNQHVFSVNDHLMSMMVTIDAVRYAGAAHITLVVPVYPYSRQHKKKGREGLTASMLGYCYEKLGVDQIITLDIHSREIENAFHTARIENLHASYQIMRELIKIENLADPDADFVVVAPDSGAVDRNKFYSSGLKKPLAMIYKERDYSVVTQNAKQSNIININLLGDVNGKTAFLADDMLGTGGTLLKAMEFLKSKGAKKVIAAVSLPFFTGDAIQLFDEAYKKGYFYRVIGTNAVYHEELLKKEWYISADVSKLFAQAVSRLYHNQSLSNLLDNREIIERMLHSAGQSGQHKADDQQD